MLEGLSELQVEKGMQVFAFPLKHSPVSTQFYPGKSPALRPKTVCGMGVDLMVDLTKVRCWFCPGADQRASYISSGDLSFLFC